MFSSFACFYLFYLCIYCDRDAWNSLGEMSKEEAMASYVDEMKLVRLPPISHLLKHLFNLSVFHVLVCNQMTQAM